jgi:hypothetical protein
VIPIGDVGAGDVVWHRGVQCTILEAPREGMDLFGRKDWRILARRHDTGAEGDLIYGQNAYLDPVWLVG